MLETAPAQILDVYKIVVIDDTHDTRLIEPELGEVFITDVISGTLESSYTVKIGLDLVNTETLSENLKREMDKAWEEQDPNLPDSLQKRWRTGEIPFDTWKEMTAFYGKEFQNPLEDSEALVYANESAIPLDAPALNGAGKHCGLSWHSVHGNKLYTANMSAGYLKDNIRVALNVVQYGDGTVKLETGAAWAEKIDFRMEEYLMKSNIKAAIVLPEGTELYTSASGYFIMDNALYMIHVTGELDQEEKVKETLLMVLDLF